MWVERGTVRVKCPRLELEREPLNHGGERTKHEATAPPLREVDSALLVSPLLFSTLSGLSGIINKNRYA